MEEKGIRRDFSAFKNGSKRSRGVAISETSFPSLNLTLFYSVTLECQAALACELGSIQPDIAWHTERDRIAEVGAFVGILCGTLSKNATDIKVKDKGNSQSFSRKTPSPSPSRLAATVHRHSAVSSDSELEHLCDQANYLDLSETIVDNVLNAYKQKLEVFFLHFLSSLVSSMGNTYDYIAIL